MSTAKRITSCFALLLGLASGLRAEDINSFFLSPTHAPAKQGFRLEIDSYRYACNASFSHQTISVGKGRIDVGFVTEYKMGVMCVANPPPKGPAFDVPALPAGRYEVYASDRPACLVAPQPCEVPEREEFAGTLVVGAAGWFIAPVAVKADVAFALQGLNPKYGSCQTTFSHISAGRYGNGILATFVVTTDSTRKCLQDRTPWGPVFSLDALPAGKYPVSLYERSACEFASPPCIAARPLTFDDTLHVLGGATSARPEPGRAQGSIRRRGGAIEIGSGFARVEILSLAGRRLLDIRPEGRAARVAAPEGAGLVLARLTTAAGETSTLPLPEAP